MPAPAAAPPPIRPPPIRPLPAPPMPPLRLSSSRRTVEVGWCSSSAYARRDGSETPVDSDASSASWAGITSPIRQTKSSISTMSGHFMIQTLVRAGVYMQVGMPASIRDKNAYVSASGCPHATCNWSRCAQGPLRFAAFISIHMST